VKVRLKRGWSKTYPELTVGNVYRVLGISPEHFRIICDSGGERPFADTTPTTITAAEFEAAWSRAMEEDDADAQS
jgi:hypothetical protein